MPSSRKPVDCSGPGRRDVLRAGVLGFLGLGRMTCSDFGPRLAMLAVSPFRCAIAF